MRMSKRKKELLRLYQCERARGLQARWALSNARTRMNGTNTKQLNTQVESLLIRNVAMCGSA